MGPDISIQLFSFLHGLEFIIPINQILARVTHYSNSWDKLDLDNVDLPEDVKDKIDDLPGYKFKNRIDRHVDISLERSIKEDETHW